LLAIVFHFEMEWLTLRWWRASLWLGMPPTHHSGVQTFLQHLSGACLEHSLTAHQNRALGLIIEISLDAIGIFL
jgi:hypothetical protein